ncbi:MAG: NAD(+) diphosphatase [Desulfuromonadales bacterium]|nr:NAD(+) diphosphatase [Desulfuromonadales bacterium]
MPDSYPSTVDLPFNRASLDAHFQLSTADRDPGTPGVWLILQGSALLIKATTSGPQLPEGDSPILTSVRPPLYIGDWQEQPCRVLNISRQAELPPNFQTISLQDRNPQLPLALLSLAGIAQMILHWEKTSRRCSHCGEQLVRLPGEWGKECRNCTHQHFPHIHPCVIGLIVRGDEILLVRKPEWADGRFGLVAGFVEFGESLEEAIKREIREETGLQVNNLRYIGSQCWPFPSQLMTGFVADYLAGEITLQEDELAEASWYKLDQLPVLPPRRSIARYLIDRAGEYLQK